MGPAHIKSNNPHKILRHVLNYLKSIFPWYTRVPTETIKLNIRLEQGLHSFTTEQWTMSWIDSFVQSEFHQSSFVVLGCYKHPLYFEAYKSHFDVFYEYLEITHIS